MRMRTAATALASGLLVLAGCTGDESDPPPESSTARATAGPDSEHLLIHGTVSRGDEPMAGAQVWLTLFPEDTSDADVGDVIDTFETPPVETDDEGGYAIELDPDQLSSRYFNGEFLNYDVGIVVDGEWGSWGSTVSLRGTDYWRSDERARVGDSAVEVSFDFDGPTIMLTDSYGETEANDLPTGSAPPGIVP
jgi:hypothetical protein